MRNQVPRVHIGSCVLLNDQAIARHVHVSVDMHGHHWLITFRQLMGVHRYIVIYSFFLYCSIILQKTATRRSPVAGRRSPVAGRRSPVAGRRSPVAGHLPRRWLLITNGCSGLLHYLSSCCWPEPSRAVRCRPITGDFLPIKGGRNCCSRLVQF